MKEIGKRIRGFLSDIGTGITFSDADAADSLRKTDGNSGAILFLDRFSESDIRRYMKKSGMEDFLSSRGFADLYYRIYADDAQIHHMELYDAVATPEHLILDLRLSQRKFCPINRSSGEVTFDLFMIEWLMTRNPRVSAFRSNRPQLPGQRVPGLGSMTQMIHLMKFAANDITHDGFMNIPDHLHLALMYNRYFQFYSPETEGMVRAVQRDLKRSGLYNIAWAAVTGSIVNRDTGVPLVYNPGEQIFPSSRRLKRYFESSEYARAVKDAMRSRYTINYELLERNKSSLVKKHSPEEV